MQPSAINHIAQPAPAARPQPNMNNRLIVDFIVPETNDSDEDAVPGQRRIKAQQVKETLHAEHPDADPEFVAAICQLVELNGPIFIWWATIRQCCAWMASCAPPKG